MEQADTTAGSAPQPFLVIAIDYDGTIAHHDRPHASALAAVDELRALGRRVLLVTGRRVPELRAVFPDVDRHFDAVVAENGAVLVMDGDEIALEEPIPAELAVALEKARIPFSTGRVLLATDAAHGKAVLREIERLGLEAKLVYNRGALMVLPAGASKGSGLLHALGRLELSRHNTIGIGDAENDHSLLHACEIGVAVGNAVPALRAYADLCLDESNGEGVAAFLRSTTRNGGPAIHPPRWDVELGATATGVPARLPGSRINLLIAGASCSGKSHLAGLFIERLLALGYTVGVLDAEGDHSVLDRLPGVIAVGGPDPLPAPLRLAALVRNRFSSIIADLSCLGADEKREYCRTALAALCELRRERGFPHWIVVEEADQLLAGCDLPGDAARGYCLVTHRPTAIAAPILDTLDAVIALPGAEQYARVPFQTEAPVPREGTPFVLESGYALLAHGDRVLTFRPARRTVAHVRHHHKYMFGHVPAELRFHFGPAGREQHDAGNITEFRTGIERAADDVLRAHLAAGDFSRWTRDVLADDELGGRLRGVERWFNTDPHAALEAARSAAIAAIRSRYTEA